MTILVVGAQGGLGKSMHVALESKNMPHECLSKRELDLSAGAAEIEKAVAGFKWVVNCAAYTDVNSSESHQAHALDANFVVVENLVAACKRTQTNLVHFSTDYVFDGYLKRPYSVLDGANPINFYGYSKFKGERASLKYDQSLVIRTSWLYSHGNNSFPEKILQRAALNQPFPVTPLEIGSPTNSKHLADFVSILINRDVLGFFHGNNYGQVSRSDYARKVLELAGLSPELVVDAELPLPNAVQRPQFSSLLATQSELFSWCSWEEALEEFLRT